MKKYLPATLIAYSLYCSASFASVVENKVLRFIDIAKQADRGINYRRHKSYRNAILEQIKMKPTITIEYCPKCHWLLRATYMAQELLTTFEGDVRSVTLQPSEIGGQYIIYINGKIVFDRKTFGGFPEIKELKQLVRDVVNPEKNLGHSDKH